MDRGGGSCRKWRAVKDYSMLNRDPFLGVSGCSELFVRDSFEVCYQMRTNLFLCGQSRGLSGGRSCVAVFFFITCISMDEGC